MARGNRQGGSLSALLWLALAGTVLLGINFAATRNSLEGRWFLHVPEDTRTQLKVLWEGGTTEGEPSPAVADAGGKSRWAKRLGNFRQRLETRGKQLLGDLGMITLVGLAEQIQLEVKGGTLSMGTEQTAALNDLIGQLSEENRGTAINCAEAHLLAVYPLLRVTCTQGTEPLHVWYSLKGWPGDEVIVFPIGVGDTQLRKFVVKLKGGDPVTTSVTIEEVNAMRALVTLHFRRQQVPASAVGAPTSSPQGVDPH